ncbi:siderophore-interacting protein [Bosea vestrisii]|uniref:siderophore-interacting protein n=1 Tax=Bosea vestrisii TaxID=151416 RepID=UPI0024E03E15|nr:siderophore-interacting protein [Bosea vestrisii]WID94951.1 siderophore-interacting protein [Bosea vestrisii]
MADETELQATASVVLADPAGMLERLCGHFVEHGQVTRRDGGARLGGPFGSVDLTADDGVLRIAVTCPDESRLFVVKSSVAEHLFEFAEGETVSLSWQGNAPAQTRIPYFREVMVRGARDITPAMRRVTLACDDPRHFTSGGLHVRVLIPPRGRAPVWPSVGPDSRVIWPQGEDTLAKRTYTIRSIDHARGELDIDVVLHDDSVGSIWAREAQAGDRIGLLGPGGGDVIPADWYLLCGDETALPAIARIAEELPSSARASIVIEVADAAEQQDIASKAAIEVTWLHRKGAPAGSTDLLAQAVRGIALPEQGSPFVFAGCEQATARAIRKHLRSERQLPKDRHLVAAYWRKGHADVHDHGD